MAQQLYSEIGQTGLQTFAGQIRAELDWSAFNRALYAMARVEGEV